MEIYFIFIDFLSLRSNVIILPIHMLETASILHVTLLVFLRLKAVKKPMEEEKNERIIRIISVSTVWLLAIFSSVIPVIILPFVDFDTFRYMKMTTLHCLGTIPVILIIIMWRSLLMIAKQSYRHASFSSNSTFLSKEELSHKRMVRIIPSIRSVVTSYID